MTRHCRAFTTLLGGVAAALLLTLPALGAGTYTVSRGDSAWKIARRLGISTQALLSANHLTGRSVLQPGQRLVAPGRSVGRGHQAPPNRATGSFSPSAACPEPAERVEGQPATRYVVKPGDTLGALAHRFGVSVKALARENGVRDPNRLRVGQTIRIPAVGGHVARPEGPPSRSAAGGLRDPRPPQEGATDNTSGNTLVDTALRYRGVPYRYAGMTTRGMDCSGLVARVLAVHGIPAPHSSRELYKLGVAVPRDQLRAGDLVFFHTRGRGISHVGIYMGDGEFVHASSSGGKVETDRLDTGYYQRRYVGARRVS